MLNVLETSILIGQDLVPRTTTIRDRHLILATILITYEAVLDDKIDNIERRGRFVL